MQVLGQRAGRGSPYDGRWDGRGECVRIVEIPRSFCLLIRVLLGTSSGSFGYLFGSFWVLTRVLLVQVPVWSSLLKSDVVAAQLRDRGSCLP